MKSKTTQRQRFAALNGALRLLKPHFDSVEIICTGAIICPRKPAIHGQLGIYSNQCGNVDLRRAGITSRSRAIETEQADTIPNPYYRP